MELLGLALGIVTVIIFVLLFFFLVIWNILTLVYQAKRNQWGWFVFTIFLGLFLVFPYWIFWMINPKLRRKKR